MCRLLSHKSCHELCVDWCCTVKDHQIGWSQHILHMSVCHPKPWCCGSAACTDERLHPANQHLHPVQMAVDTVSVDYIVTETAQQIRVVYLHENSQFSRLLRSPILL